MGLYGLITRLRNLAFDKQWLGFKTKTFPQVKSICVGNLSVGGTGKTPMVVFLTRHFLGQNKTVAILSLGYKRKKQGNFFATTSDGAAEIGDEPALYIEEFRAEMEQKRLVLYLCKKRAEGMVDVLKHYPQIDVVLLDDGYQHRYVKAEKNVLLTPYYKPFYQDKILPYGHLREYPSEVHRANAVVMTKCPENLSEREAESLIKACPFEPKSAIFFSSIEYKKVVGATETYPVETFFERCRRKVILVTGIASTKPLVDYLHSQNVAVLRHFNFADHHRFTLSELKEVEQFYREACADGQTPALLTTQKDYMRLMEHEAMRPLPWHYLWIETQILFNREADFLKTLGV